MTISVLIPSAVRCDTPVIHAVSLVHIAVISVVLTLLCPCVALAQESYLRLSVGYETANDTRWQDNDCGSTLPPALFGCGSGVDGRALGAYGDFGPTPAFEIALGKTVHSLFRLEAVLAQRNGFEFVGNANFTGAGPVQPVSSSVSQFSAMAFGYVDLSLLFGLTPGDIEPYLGAGIGVARNRTSPVTYTFPGLTQPAWTIVPGGGSYQFALAATAGLGWPLTNNLMLDIAWRFSDYGRVETDSGTMEIQRGARPPTALVIDSTYATLRSHAIYTGLRLSF